MAVDVVDSPYPPTPVHLPMLEVEHARKQGAYLIEQHQLSQWVPSFVRRMEELLRLRSDWDSYGAHVVNIHHARTALGLLSAVMQDETPAPIVVPTAQGGLQIEWHERGIDLEIEVLSSQRFYVSFEDARTDEKWDREITADLSPLVDAIGRLTKRV